jgi:hypothetical protein
MHDRNADMKINSTFGISDSANIASCQTEQGLKYKTFLVFALFNMLFLGRLPANPLPDYLGAENVPQMPGDQYCGAYVVWHALRHYGKAVSIDAIIEEMKLQESKGVSIADVVSSLKHYGLQARAVKLRLDNITSLERPFIPYIPPSKKGNAFGHFILCVPIGSGHALLLDGQKDPYITDLKLLKEKEYRTGWDGTSILLEGSNRRGITLNGATSQRLLYPGLAVILLASLWLFYKNRTGRQTMQRRSSMDID